MHNKRVQSVFGKLRLPQPLMRSTMTRAIGQKLKFKIVNLALLSILVSGCFGSATVVKVETKPTVVVQGEIRVAKPGYRLVVIDVNSPTTYYELESDPLLADEENIPETQSDSDSWSRLDDGIPVSPYPMDENWEYLESTSTEGRQAKHLRYIYELEEHIDLAFLYIDDFEGLKIGISGNVVSY